MQPYCEHLQDDISDMYSDADPGLQLKKTSLVE